MWVLKGEAGAYIKAHVLFMEACLSFNSLIETKGSFLLDQHDKGIDLVFCHEGIMLKCQFKADLSIDGDLDEDNPIYEATPIDKEWEIYPVADLLTLDQSDIRFNLTGEIRNITDRIKPAKVQ